MTAHLTSINLPNGTAYLGDPVYKIKGNYAFHGWIVAIFHKRGKPDVQRVVVENEDGILHVFSPNQLDLGISKATPKLDIEKCARSCVDEIVRWSDDCCGLDYQEERSRIYKIIRIHLESSNQCTPSP